MLAFAGNSVLCRVALAQTCIAPASFTSIWYTALPALKATSAATVQLSVPVLVTLGGFALSPVFV